MSVCSSYDDNSLNLLARRRHIMFNSCLLSSNTPLFPTTSLHKTQPENILLSEQGGHVILIDFGTAKDLIVTDLNGPEFVGTPDFMSPEAVKEPKEGSAGSDFTVDLWALGVVIYQLYAGALPFESQR